MTIEQLEQFMTVARLKSYTRAAESLFISHSTISKNISALEAELDITLLNRNSKTVSLTNPGQTFFAECERLEADWENVMRKVKSVAEGSNGFLKIATMNFYDDRFFNVVKDFCRRYPDIHFLMQSYSPVMTRQQMENNEADIGIAFSFELLGLSDEFDYIALYPEKMCLVVRPDHLFATRNRIRIQDLKDEKIYYLSIGKDQRVIRDINRSIGMEGIGKNPENLDSVESLVMHVRSGQGISLLPGPIARQYSDGVTLIDIEDMEDTFDVVLYWKENNCNPALRRFLEMIYQNYDRLVRE